MAIGAGALRKTFTDMLKVCSKKPEDIEELSKLHDYVDSVPNLIGAQAELTGKIKSYDAALNSFQFQSQESVQAKWKAFAMPKQIFEQLEVMAEVMAEKKTEYSAAQQDEQSIFEQTLSALESEVQSFATYTDIKRVEMVSKHVLSVRAKRDPSPGNHQWTLSQHRE